MLVKICQNWSYLVKIDHEFFLKELPIAIELFEIGSKFAHTCKKMMKYFRLEIKQ